jgi:hypothetical protein
MQLNKCAILGVVVSTIDAKRGTRLMVIGLFVFFPIYKTTLV